MAQQARDPAQTGPDDSSLHYGGVPLVSGRATVARVFADPVGLGIAGISGLKAQLYGTVNGHPCPAARSARTRAARRPSRTRPSPRSWGHQHLDQLPAAHTWTRGHIELGAAVAPEPIPPAGTTAACSGSCSATLTLTTVHLHRVPTFQVTPVEVTWTNKKTCLFEAPGNPQAAMATAYHLMPVQIVNEPYQGTD